MNRYLLFFAILVAMCISCALKISVLLAEEDGIVKIEIKIDEQIAAKKRAAEVASNLANLKCKDTFGKAPFTPESYSAQLRGSKWHWGKIEPPGIHGFSAEVEFNTDESDQKVRVVFHTDRLDMRVPDQIPMTMEVIEPEEGEVLEED